MPLKKRSFWNKKINRDKPDNSLFFLTRPKRSVTAHSLKKLFKRPRQRSKSIIPSLRDKQPVDKAIIQVTNAALRIGSANIPQEQKRMDTLNIDTDDEEMYSEDESNDGIIDEEEKSDSSKDDDFDEITEHLCNADNLKLRRSSSLYALDLKMMLYFYGMY